MLDSCRHRCSQLRVRAWPERAAFCAFPLVHVSEAAVSPRSTARLRHCSLKRDLCARAQPTCQLCVVTRSFRFDLDTGARVRRCLLRGRQSWWPIWETIQPLATGLVLSQGAVRTEWHRGLGTGPGKGRTWCREVQELRASAALSPRGRGAREGSRYQPGGAFGVGHHVIYVQIGTLPRVKAPLQPRWTAGELGVSHHSSAR